MYKSALEILRTKIRSSTSSITAVPKPLKFLRPHYKDLKVVHENMKNSECKVSRSQFKLKINLFLTSCCTSLRYFYNFFPNNF